MMPTRPRGCGLHKVGLIFWARTNPVPEVLARTPTRSKLDSKSVSIPLKSLSGGIRPPKAPQPVFHGPKSQPNESAPQNRGIFAANNRFRRPNRGCVQKTRSPQAKIKDYARTANWSVGIEPVSKRQFGFKGPTDDHTLISS